MLIMLRTYYHDCHVSFHANSGLLPLTSRADETVSAHQKNSIQTAPANMLYARP